MIIQLWYYRKESQGILDSFFYCKMHYLHIVIKYVFIYKKKTHNIYIKTPNIPKNLGKSSKWMWIDKLSINLKKFELYFK